MRQQEVFNKIGGIINELTEQYNYLKTEEIPLNDLELELFAANANFLADHLEVLRKLNANMAVKAAAEVASPIEVTPEPEAIGTPVEQEQVEEEYAQVPEAEEESPAFEFDFTSTKPEPATDETPQEIPEEHEDVVYLDDEEEHKSEHFDIAHEEAPVPEMDLKPDTGNDHFSFIRSTEPDIIRHELELSEADTFNDDQPHEETIAEALAGTHHEDKQDEEQEFVPSFHINDVHTPEPSPEEKPLTLNERIAAQTGHVQPKTEVQRITDLKSAITLNDKMLFVRDLFNGYSLAYSEAIEILNRFSKLEDAERFLAVNYEEKNHWHDKYATRQKFFELLRRRFD